MEGYLLIKEESNGLITKKKWVKRFFILIKSTLTCYGEFDLKGDTPISKKCSFDVKGSSISPLPKGKYDFMIEIIHWKNPTINLRAEDEATLIMWITALNNGSANPPLSKRSIQISSHYSTLGIDRNTQLTQQLLDETYAALQPTDAETVSYKKLCLKLKMDAAMRSFTYSCLIRKTESGLGLGLRENYVSGSDKEGLLVTRLPNLVVVGTTPASLTLETDDQLIGVAKDDCSEWTVLHVAQRCNLTRAPVGSVIKFTLRRFGFVSMGAKQAEVGCRDIPVTSLRTPPVSPSTSHRREASHARAESTETSALKQRYSALERQYEAMEEQCRQLKTNYAGYRNTTNIIFCALTFALLCAFFQAL